MYGLEHDERAASRHGRLCLAFSSRHARAVARTRVPHPHLRGRPLQQPLESVVPPRVQVPRAGPTRTRARVHPTRSAPWRAPTRPEAALRLAAWARPPVARPVMAPPVAAGPRVR